MHHDVIVVGAGLGGLSAAAFLARAGLNVRLLERHVQPGGYATTFLRGGYEFEVSLHELSGIGTPADRGSLWYLLEELGVTRQVEFLRVPGLYRTVAPGLDLRIPPGREAALDALCTAFPHERRGLTRLMDDIFALRRELEAMSDEDSAGAAGDAGAAPLMVARFPRVAHAATVPLASVVSRELGDPLARLAFCQLWGFMGLPPSRLNFVSFAAAFASYLRFGASYPRGKSQALSNALADAIESAGGRVSLGRGVRRILTNGGRVTGVVDDHDERHEADVVVSNVDPVTTCVDLLGPAHVPPAFLRALGASRPGLSTVCVHLGLEARPEELGLADHEVFFNRTVDLEEQYRSCLGTGAPQEFTLTVYNAVDPEYAPPGRTGATLTALADGDAWARVSPNAYVSTKRRLADSMLTEVERLYPGFRDRIEVAAVSTPITNMRYTGNRCGAIYGFEATTKDNPGWRMDQRGPIDGLWFAGAWTRPGGGFEPCITSGRAVARRILAEAKGSPR